MRFLVLLAVLAGCGHQADSDPPPGMSIVAVWSHHSLAVGDLSIGAGSDTGPSASITDVRVTQFSDNSVDVESSGLLTMGSAVSPFSNSFFVPGTEKTQNSDNSTTFLIGTANEASNLGTIIRYLVTVGPTPAISASLDGATAVGITLDKVP